MTNKMDEVIIVTPRKALFESEKLAFQGLETDPENLNKLFTNMSENFGILRRGNAEEDERFKQPIPYVVLVKGEEVFVYERLGAGGEKRLEGMLSIGIGGHMNNTDDDSFMQVVGENMFREIYEELEVKGDIIPTILGFINDDSDDVGKVHFGILAIAHLTETTVEVKEKDQLDGYWVPVDELKKDHLYNRLENWSKLAIDFIAESNDEE